jgi:hypothetical protein
MKSRIDRITNKLIIKLIDNPLIRDTYRRDIVQFAIAVLMMALFRNRGGSDIEDLVKI